MREEIIQAKDLLVAGGYTCVLQQGDTVYTSVCRGVKPLFDWCESGVDATGFVAADKVVGKGAAFLYVALGVSAVYAAVISEAARSVLEAHGIAVSYDTLVPHIVNRQGDGMCPFEAAVWDVADPGRAYKAIQAKMREMGL